MKANEWLDLATKNLASSGVSTARLDALILLEDVTNKDRAYLLAHPEYELSAAASKDLTKSIARRSQHEPLAYIRGHCEFYGRDFVVTHDTLQPRPDSEAFINILKTLVFSGQKKTILDIGTGSGALAITAGLEFPDCKVLATDISDAALKVAGINAHKLAAKITFLSGNLLAPLTAVHYPVDIVMANLPYVPNQYTINQAATHEPKVAIFGGADGLDVYRLFFQQIDKLAQKPAVILTESLAFQHLGLKTLASKHGYNCTDSKGLVLSFHSSQL